jgi:Type-IV b secretion system, inner-membrane complex component
MSFDLLEKRRNEMYRRAYPKLLVVFVFLSVLAVILTLTLTLITLTQPAPKNYAALSTGEIIPIYAYSEPVLTDSYIRSWATIASRSVLNLTFNNYKAELTSASVYFQPEAFKALNDALLANGYLKSITSSKLIMRSYVNGPVVIVWQGMEDGQFVWRVQLPITIGYEGASATATKSIIAQLVIARVATADNPGAILIKSIRL